MSSQQWGADQFAQFQKENAEKQAAANSRFTYGIKGPKEVGKSATYVIRLLPPNDANQISPIEQYFRHFFKSQADQEWIDVLCPVTGKLTGELKQDQQKCPICEWVSTMYTEADKHPDKSPESEKFRKIAGNFGKKKVFLVPAIIKKDPGLNEGDKKREGTVAVVALPVPVYNILDAAMKSPSLGFATFDRSDKGRDFEITVVNKAKGQTEYPGTNFSYVTSVDVAGTTLSQDDVNTAVGAINLRNVRGNDFPSYEELRLIRDRDILVQHVGGDDNDEHESGRFSEQPKTAAPAAPAAAPTKALDTASLPTPPAPTAAASVAGDDALLASLSADPEIAALLAGAGALQ